jgi:hypothetical protein
MLRAALLTIVLVAFTAGCGKTSNQAKPAAPTSTVAAPASQTPATTIHPSTGKPLTQAQWVAKGDAICAKLIGQQTLLRINNLNELPRVIPQMLIYTRATIAALSKLTPPTNKTNDWQTFLSLKSQWVRGAAQLGTDPEIAHTLATNPLFRTLTATRIRADTLVQHDGFNKCSRI